jgi:hypothetical protein
MNIDPSISCLSSYGDTPLYQIRQGLNNCCYRTCDELNNPYGDNTLHKKCFTSCHNFSNNMIREMGKDPYNYQHLFVRPPSHLKVTNALKYINSNNFLKDCQSDCAMRALSQSDCAMRALSQSDCRTDECLYMCQKVNDSIFRNNNTILRDNKENNNKIEDKEDNMINKNVIIGFFIILLIVLINIS